MKNISFLALIGWLLFVLTGCQLEPQQQAVKPVCVTGMNKQAALAAAEDVLVRMHFVIEKLDVQAGYIRTRPLMGAQSFEFWREDNVGRFNRLQSNLHTIRRTVEMRVSESPGQLCIAPVVSVERMSLPERDAYNLSQASTMFTGSDNSMQQLRLYPDQRAQMEWIDLGRDSRLEEKITTRLKAKLY